MAATTAFAEDLTCSVCLEVFDNPLTLPCMHSFCKRCLKNLTIKGTCTRLKCPECRMDAGLDGLKAVDHLPKNFALANLAEKFRKMTVGVVVPCCMCEEDPKPAVRTCLDCSEMSYCEECLQQFHPMRGKMKGHRLVDIKSSGEIPAESKTQSDNIEPHANLASTTYHSFDTRDHNDKDVSQTDVGVIHPHVICDGCDNAVCGVRYKCRECDDYDLCSQCESLGIHSQHDMIKVIKPKLHFKRVIFKLAKFDEISGVHPKILCDLCNERVRGVRYNCCECDNYDLCMSCETQGYHPNHDKRKVVKPKHFRNRMISEDEALEMRRTGVVHPRVLCDVCDSVVRGSRFKCSVCRDYDLCGVCLVRGCHPKHDMREIKSPL